MTYSFKEICLEKYFDNNQSILNNLFSTKEWLDFIKNTQNAVPIGLEIYSDEVLIGCFCGAITKKFGFKILGSPFKGWTTCYMGFDFKNNLYYERDKYVEILKSLSKYIYKKYKCLYIEIVDRNVNFGNLKLKNIQFILEQTYELDITKSEDELFMSFKNDVRTNTRFFLKNDGRIEKTEEIDDFGKLYYNQLLDVFAKQNLKPTYDERRLIELLKSLNSANKICLKAINCDGICVATSIYTVFGDRAYFWGNASDKNFMSTRPNEILMWYAIKYAKESGVKILDLCGLRGYKKKYNPVVVDYNRIIVSRWKILILLRNLAAKIFALRQRKKK